MGKNGTMYIRIINTFLLKCLNLIEMLSRKSSKRMYEKGTKFLVLMIEQWHICSDINI